MLKSAVLVGLDSSGGLLELNRGGVEAASKTQEPQLGALFAAGLSVWRAQLLAGRWPSGK